ncbi:hypothetical protein Bca4012_048567 [Brassica carinata]|uniref:Uncharacterized protein n=2 Tax=Brassica TaxID=3705 RepID=A0A8S9KTB0_BRACR|nr:hypothetical protein F2Q68_00007829 [Brassica cretica]KAG2280289.1 hypothetical protein Bca52824_051509 [Brassica carinata]
MTNTSPFELLRSFNLLPPERSLVNEIFRVDHFGMDTSETTMACISISNDVISKMRSEVDGGLHQSLLPNIHGVSLITANWISSFFPSNPVSVFLSCKLGFSGGYSKTKMIRYLVLDRRFSS